MLSSLNPFGYSVAALWYRRKYDWVTFFVVCFVTAPSVCVFRFAKESLFSFLTSVALLTQQRRAKADGSTGFSRKFSLNESCVCNQYLFRSFFCFVLLITAHEGQVLELYLLQVYLRLWRRECAVFVRGKYLRSALTRRPWHMNSSRAEVRLLMMMMMMIADDVFPITFVRSTNSYSLLSNPPSPFHFRSYCGCRGSRHSDSYTCCHSSAKIGSSM